jgi:hypothetical protein
MLSVTTGRSILSTEDLRAMDLNTAALTGLKLAGYERPCLFGKRPSARRTGTGLKRTFNMNDGHKNGGHKLEAERKETR